MTMPRANEPDLAELLDALCEDTLTPDAAARLEQLVRGNPERQLQYLAYMYLDAALRWDRPAGIPRHTEELDQPDSAAMVRSALPISPEILSASLPDPLTTVHGALGSFFSGWPVAYLVATVVLSAGLLIGAFVHVSERTQVAGGDRATGPLCQNGPKGTPRPSFVGRITGTVDCQWTDPKTEAFNGENVPLGRKYALRSGLMEITYDTGAKVILQGPVTYEVESPVGGYLSIGKLTARVEKNRERRTKNEELSDSRSSFLIPHSYFAVRTPTAMVTDLGTEFGVEVSTNGETTSHVFRGSVSLQVAGSDNETGASSQILHENESGRVERSGDGCVIVSGSSTKPTGFVRRLAWPTIKAFDLVDVVAGGDGFSGLRDRGIDPRNGRPVDTRISENPVFGDGKYHRVEGLPLIDGVFIPHGGIGPVQLDSAGHTFDGFGPTDNKTVYNVWAGQTGLDIAELGGIDYDSAGHGQIAMCANKGITFDLDAIRRANPEWKLLRFRAVGGNTELVSEKGSAVYASLWVFVDGQVRFRRREINRYNGAMPIIIPINDNDRFLTLVATDGGNSYQQDHTMFGDPRLELAPAKGATDTTPPQEAAGH